MIIKLATLCSKYGINKFAVLHIGAHQAQERDSYQQCGASKVVWIEAIPGLASELEKRISSTDPVFSSEKVFNIAAFDTDNEEVEFNVSNLTQASSLLEFGTYQESHPEIKMEQKITVTTRRIDSLAREHPHLFKDLNFATLDVQGVEHTVLHGFGESLTQFKWIFVEVNRREVYQGGCMIWDIDRLLLQFGFFRHETHFTRDSWGDAFYEKRSEISSVSRFVYQTKLRIQYLIWTVIETSPVKFSIQLLRQMKYQILSK